MKKTLTLVVACLLASCIAYAVTGGSASVAQMWSKAVATAAQVFNDDGRPKLKTAPVSMSAAAKKAFVQKRTADAASELGEIWGYYPDYCKELASLPVDPYTEVGLGVKVQAEPGTLLTAVSVPFNTAEVRDVRVEVYNYQEEWGSAELLAEKWMEEVQGGNYNLVVLDNPIEFPESGTLFVCYRCTTTELSEEGVYPIVLGVSETPIENSCWIWSDKEWTDNSSNNWVCVLQVYLKEAATPENPDKEYVVIDDNFEDWTSDNHDDGSSSSMTWNFTCQQEGTLLSFDYAVSSEGGYDNLNVTLDGETLLNVSGEESGTYTKVLNDVTEHVLMAQYSKDGSGSNGSDNGSVRNIKLMVETLNAEQTKTYIAKQLEQAQAQLAALEGYDALIVLLQPALAELEELAAGEPEFMAAREKVNEVHATIEAALRVKSLLEALCEKAAGYQELYVVTGSEALGAVLAEVATLAATKAELTLDSEGNILTLTETLAQTVADMNLESTRVWDFNISDKTKEWLSYDAMNVSNWRNNGDNFWCGNWMDGWGMLSCVTNVETGETCYLPETEGLYFNWGGNGWYVHTNGTNRIQTGGAGSEYAFGFPNLKKGQRVTINYSSMYGNTRGVGRYTNNTNVVAGQEMTTGTAEVTYEVTANGDAYFYPYNGSIYINSITLNTRSAASQLVALRQEVADYMPMLEDFPGLKDELQTVYDAAVLTGDVQDGEMLVEQLTTVFRNVKTAVEVYPSLLAYVEEADSVLAETAVEELPAALALGKAIDVNTSKSEEYLVANEALKTALAVYHAGQVEMSEWAFNTTSVVTVNGLSYHLDSTHQLAEFIGFSNSNVAMTTLEVPMTFDYEGTAYCVVAMANWNQNEQRYITSVKLPKSLRSIGDRSFWYYSNLRYVEIPEGVTTMGSQIFYYCDNYPHTIKVNAVVPPSVGSFGGNSHKRVIIPQESFHAYRMANGWKDCVLIGGEGVTVSTGKIAAGDLGHVVLEEATYLQEVNRLIINEGTLNNDDWNTIKSMTNLIEIDLSGVTAAAVPNNAFDGRWALEKVMLPHNLTSIGYRAFYGTGIKEVDFPETLSTFGSEAFRNCDSLSIVSIPAGVSGISDYCFYDCDRLQQVNLPEGLSSINYYAFCECNMLRDVNLPASLTSIGEAAFYQCPLKKIEIPAGVTQINSSAFAYNAAIDTLVIPATVKTIRGSAFRNSSSLKSLQLNEGLVEMAGSAFSNCTNLEEVVLPSSLEKCQSAPFYGCTGIKKMEVRAVIPPTTNSNCPLNGVDLTGVTLFVPSWSKSEYALADGWKDFYTIEVSDFMPQNIKVNKDFYFTLRDTLEADYRPNIYMTFSDVEATDAYGHTNYERGNLTISGRSKLAVNDLSMVVSPYAKYYADHNVANGYDYDNYRTEINSTSLIVNGEMRAENVVQYLITMNNRWQFVTFPFDVKVSDIVPNRDDVSWVIRGHNGAMRAAGKNDSVWVNLTADDVLEAGKGYIMHNYNPSYSNSRYYVSPLKNSVNRQLIFESGDRTIALEEHLSEFDHNRSWNLIGNPYPCFYDTRFMDFDAPFMVWNSYNQNYVAYNPADDAYILSPGEAFFVQRPFEQEAITFRKEGRQNHRYAREMEVESPARAKAYGDQVRQIFNLKLQQDSLADRTRIVMNDAAQLNYEVNRDAAKFASAEPSVPQIFTLMGKTRYAINERPNDNGEVALGIYCGTDGEYTITIDKTNDCNVMLEDRLTGKFVELTAGEGYTFAALAGESLDRFVLYFMRDTNGINGVDTNMTNDDDEAIYNLKGIEVNNTREAGVYVKNGQKIVK